VLVSHPNPEGGKNVHHTIVSIALFLILGVVTGWKLSPCPWILFFIALAIAALWLWAKRGRRRVLGHVLVLLLVTTIGALRSQTGDPTRRTKQLEALVLAGRCSMQLVVDTPVERFGKCYSFTASVEWCEFEGSRLKKLPGHVAVLLVGTPSAGAPTYGTRLRASTVLKALRPRPTSPWSDARDRLRARGIVVETTLQAFAVRTIEGPAPSRLRAWLHRGRCALCNILDTTHEERTSAFLRALLFGDRSMLPPVLWTEFRRAGTIHLLAQSGLHVGILALVAYAVFSGIRCGRRGATIGTIIIVIVYCGMVGLRASVLRAALMVTCILIGKLIGRQTSHFASLAAAAIILILAEPAFLASPGFQLSFIATLGILYLSPVLADVVSFLPSGLAALLSVSLAAWLVTAPLSLYHFDGVPLAGPLANVAILPIVGILIPSALLSLAASLFSTYAGFLLGAVDYALVSLLILVNALFAAPSLPMIRVATLPVPAILCWYLILIAAGEPRGIRAIMSRLRSNKSDTATELLEDEAVANDDELFRDFSAFQVLEKDRIVGRFNNKLITSNLFLCPP